MNRLEDHSSRNEVFPSTQTSSSTFAASIDEEFVQDDYKKENDHQDVVPISSLPPQLHQEKDAIVKVPSQKVHSPSSKDIDDDDDEDLVPINDDVYNMFFLSLVGGQAFYYAAYVFLLKMALYTFLAMDAVEVEQPDEVEAKVRVTQFLMLPVAVAMQDDLIATFYLIANLKYSSDIRKENPDASKWKFHFANICRGIDGIYSLLVNFVVLLKATEVLPLFLNFAALQFLQTIDNIACQLAEAGYLTERLVVVAHNVKKAKLPQKHNKWFRALDTILFLTTYLALVVAWSIICFAA